MLAPLPIRTSGEGIILATYDTLSGELSVTFDNGRSYTYGGVPVWIVTGFVGADNPTGYYVENIRGKYGRR